MFILDFRILFYVSLTTAHHIYFCGLYSKITNSYSIPPPVKKLKKILFYSFALLLISWVFSGCIYRSLVTYKSVGQRTLYSISDKGLQKMLGSLDANFPQTGIEDIIEKSLEVSSNHLSFSTFKCSNDPNKLIKTPYANCVGYAHFFATSCNYLLKQKGLDRDWTAHVHIGKLYLLGNNLHDYFSSPFFKDHDFVVIRNKKTGETIAVDPTINDFWGIQKVGYSKD